MESRLPKPKIIIGKSVSTMDIKSNNQNITKNGTTTSASTNCAGAKSSQEDKLKVNQTLLRAKTLASITRSNTNTKGVKRQATTITHGEPKKPFVRPVRAVANKPSTSGLANNRTTNKVTQNTTDNKTGKIQKWDLRGRLAHTSDKLSAVQQKNKDIESKYNKLQNLTNTLEANEALYREKAEKLEIENKALITELESVTQEMTEIKLSNKDLTKRLEELEKLLSEYQKECKLQEVTLKEQTEQLTTLKAKLETTKERNKVLNTLNEDLQSLSHKLDKERRILHNNIQELKGNIRVFCRVRPRTPKEIELTKMPCSINFIDDCTIEISKDGSDGGNYGKRATKQEFSFDKVFAPNATQEDVFEELALLVQSALEGYNVCVFAYGQTGSGKTYTMEGEQNLHTEGMIPRTIRHIFKEKKQFELLGWEYKIKASFLEIYNEHIVDLLESHNQPKTHDIRMVDSKGQDLYVSNLRVEEIHSPEEMRECLRIAQCNRAVAATQSNERSSRSHSVAQIRLIGTHTTKGEVSGNLNLVDLAGSERLKTEEAFRTTETKFQVDSFAYAFFGRQLENSDVIKYISFR